MAGLVLDFFKR